jgi:uncharacterized membrane-anchored protein YitT (DUF2179 family)
MRKRTTDYIEIFIGVILIALGIELFYVPHNLVTGGVTGIAIIFLDLGNILFGFGIPLWVTNISLNLPLILLSYKLLGVVAFKKTLFSILSLTTIFLATPYLPDIDSDIFLAVIFGGAFVGIGTALILRAGATSGGTVLLSALIHRYLRHIKVTTIVLTIDIIIVVAGMLTFSVLTALYAIVSIYVFMKVTDTVLSGFQTKKATYILSRKSAEVSAALLTGIDRGITAIPARGVYSGMQKDMLMCIMNPQELVKAKDIVREIDPDAFIVVSSASEVLGEGFSSLE